VTFGVRFLHSWAVYIYIHTHIYAYVHIRMHMCTQTCSPSDPFAKQGICIYKYSYMFIYIHLHVYACIHLLTYICTHTCSPLEPFAGSPAANVANKATSPSGMGAYSASFGLRWGFE